MFIFIIVIHIPLTNETYQNPTHSLLPPSFLLSVVWERLTLDSSVPVPDTKLYRHYFKVALILSSCQFLFYSNKLTLPQTCVEREKGCVQVLVEFPGLLSSQWLLGGLVDEHPWCLWFGNLTKHQGRSSHLPCVLRHSTPVEIGNRRTGQL